MIVFSHRGLDLDRPEKLAENSIAAFRWAAERGFGVELDLQFTRDQHWIVAHDATIERWSSGAGRQPWSALTMGEIAKLGANFGPIASLKETLELARAFPRLTLALHFKGANQRGPLVSALGAALAPWKDLHTRLLIFDLKFDTAAALRRALPAIGLAPSVVHEFDIQRYQTLCHGTLSLAGPVKSRRNDFDWVWLDEWDRLGQGETRKDFYAEAIGEFHAKGFKVAVISPELHRDELHQDAEPMPTLTRRWRDLIRLGPNAICTDYPARFSALLSAAGA